MADDWDLAPAPEVDARTLDGEDVDQLAPESVVRSPYISGHRETYWKSPRTGRWHIPGYRGKGVDLSLSAGITFEVLHDESAASAARPLAVGDTVETEAQLGALPVGAVVRDVNGAVFERWAGPDGKPFHWALAGGGTVLVPILSARVLDLPEDAS